MTPGVGNWIMNHSTDEQKEGLVAHGKAEEYLVLVRGGYEGTAKANMLLKKLPIATTSLIFNSK